MQLQQAGLTSESTTISLPPPVGDLVLQHKLGGGAGAKDVDDAALRIFRSGQEALQPSDTALATWLASPLGQQTLAEALEGDTQMTSGGGAVPRVALVLGCGTGGAACVLGRMGYDVLAIDDAPYCSLTEANAAHNGVPAHHVQTLPVKAVVEEEGGSAAAAQAALVSELYARLPGGVCPPMILLSDSAFDTLPTADWARTLRELVARDTGARLVVHAWSASRVAHVDGCGEVIMDVISKRERTCFAPSLFMSTTGTDSAATASQIVMENEESFLATCLGDLTRAPAVTAARYTPPRDSAVPGDVPRGVTLIHVRGPAAERERAAERWWRRPGPWCSIA